MLIPMRRVKTTWSKLYYFYFINICMVFRPGKQSVQLIDLRIYKNTNAGRETYDYDLIRTTHLSSGKRVETQNCEVSHLRNLQTCTAHCKKIRSLPTFNDYKSHHSNWCRSFLLCEFVLRLFADLCSTLITHIIDHRAQCPSSSTTNHVTEFYQMFQNFC